jgi:hypothetical protein
MRRETVLSIFRKLFGAIGLTMLFAVVSIFPCLGYVGEAQVSVEGSDPLGWLLVRAKCNMTYNPLIFPLTWLSGRGVYSGSFLFWSKPTYYGGQWNARTGAANIGIVWRAPDELENEAISLHFLDEFYKNIPFILILFFVIGLLNVQDLYLALAFGIFGFPLFGTIGTLLFFSAGYLGLILLKNRFGLEEEVMSRIWEFLLEKSDFA